jgi:hypothetical protein
LRPGVGRFSLSRKTPAGGLSRGGVFLSSNRIGGGVSREGGRRDSGKGKVDGGWRCERARLVRNRRGQDLKRKSPVRGTDAPGG